MAGVAGDDVAVGRAVGAAMKWHVRIRIRMPGGHSVHYTEDVLHYLLRWCEKWSYVYTGPNGSKGQGQSIGHLISEANNR